MLVLSCNNRAGAWLSNCLESATMVFLINRKTLWADHSLISLSHIVLATVSTSIQLLLHNPALWLSLCLAGLCKGFHTHQHYINLVYNRATV